MKKNNDERSRRAKNTMCCRQCNTTDILKFQPKNKIDLPNWNEAIKQQDNDSLIKMKKVTCEDCSLSDRQRACKAEWDKMKTELAKRGCVDCGCKDSRVIEADHTRDKVRHLSYYMSWKSVDDMRLEFEKCVPRCRFCHQVKSEKERELKDIVKAEHIRRYTQDKRNYNISLKEDRGECFECQRVFTEETQAGFDWSHRNREEKKYNIGKLVSDCKSPLTAFPLILVETHKCELLCANCHKLDTDQGK